MMNFLETRKQIYGYHQQYYSYIFRRPWYSYRKYKAIFFMECASIFVFVLLKTPITPNMVTLSYIILNICAGFLLAVPLKLSVLMAAVLLFIKPLPDWVDGPLARIQNKTSITGDILDEYSASMGWPLLWAGLGIYLGNSVNGIFYYLTPVLPTIFAIDIYRVAREKFIYNYFTKPEFRKMEKDKLPITHTKSHSHSLIRKFKDAIDKIFEHNTIAIDIICLILLIELFSSMHILWYFYSAFLIWQVTIFAVRLVLISRGGWAENELKKLQKTLYE